MLTTCYLPPKLFNPCIEIFNKKFEILQLSLCISSQKYLLLYQSYNIIYSQNMQANTAAQPNTSSISIKFGQFTSAETNSINIQVNAEYCSNKTENKRFNSAEYLSTEIPLNSILFEIQAKDDGEELANKMNQIRKTSESMKQLDESGEVNLKIIGKDKRAFIVLTSEQIGQKIEQLNKAINTQDLVAHQEKWLQLKIKSNNSFSRVKELMEKQGLVPAILDSLFFSVKFTKSENIKQLVMKMLKSGFPEAVSSSFVDSFQFINVDIQLESASVLQSFPKLQEKFKLYQINDDFKQIQPLLGKKFEVFVFGKPISITGSLNAEDLYLILDLLFA